MFLIAAMITFFTVWLIMNNMPSHWVRRMVGHILFTDLLVHGTIIWMFLGTSTLGLLQAECAGIMFSLWLRYYRWAWGYEILSGGKWMRFSGRFT